MQIKTEILINAPVEKVWEVLTAFANYPEWNPFIRKINNVKSVGDQINVTIDPPNQNPMNFSPQLLCLDENQEFRWKGKLFFKGLFDGEHYFQLQPDGKGNTLFVHGEHFSGLLVNFIMKRIGKDTLSGFEAMNQALKERVESQI
ncbi:MAG: SRPBCC domain-containing protein [Bacteroidota bacterium]